MEAGKRQAERPECTPLSIKLWYGAPSLAGAALNVPIAVHLAQFYSDAVLVPLGYVAAAIAVARALDALTDPLMAWVTDRTRTRWGRRKPYILIGAPLCAIVFWALFSPPGGLSATAASVWFGITFCLYLITHKVFVVPHAALGPEVVLEYHERSSLFGIQAIFIQVGVISAAVLPAFLIGSLGPGSERQAFSLLAASLGLTLVVLYGFMLWKVPERPEFSAREPNPLVPGIRRALRNRPFRILFLFNLIAALPGAIPAVMMRYFTFYVVRPEQPEMWFAVFLTAYFLTGTLLIPLWLAAARRFGKLPTYVAAFLIGTTGSVFFFFAGEGDTIYVTVVCGLIGIQSAAGLFLMPAMGADTIDYDELLTGKRREAQFGVLWWILPKFVAIPGMAIPIAILAAVGYVPNQEQTPEVLLMIRALMGLFPIAFSVVALVVLSRYPISEVVHRKIREGIEAHARGDSVVDPLTARTLPPPSEREVEEETGWFLDYFSPGELRRGLRLGNGRVLRDVLRAAAASLIACLGATWISFARISSADVEPGMVAVVAVVVSGLSLTAFFFHALRIRPARRLARATVSSDTVRIHLKALE
jgi:GPH family glycoside/pentoside/hexuronide:cation symporter